MKSQYHLGFILLDNQIIIDYVANQTYILTASKTWQIQVNCLLQSETRFLYDTSVNYLKTEILQFQSHANPLGPSSLRGWVRDLVFSAYWFFIPTPQIRYIHIYICWKQDWIKALQSYLKLHPLWVTLYIYNIYLLLAFQYWRVSKYSPISSDHFRNIF